MEKLEDKVMSKVPDITGASPAMVTPIYLCGNTLSTQRAQFQEILDELSKSTLEMALNELDQISLQTVIESADKLKKSAVEQLMTVIRANRISNRFLDEEVDSRRVYPRTYRIKSIEAQVTELRKAFPQLRNANEKLARKPLLAGAEGWFAIPRWQVLADTYNEALVMVLQQLNARRRFSNRILERMGPEYLRQSDRTKTAQEVIAGQQSGYEILIVPAQFGMQYRGSSARRARVSMAGHEFALGAFELACMLLTHPERLSAEATLMIDCAGDEYSISGDSFFDRVPLYDYDITGLQFSIFYEDRAYELWGTPTGFVYKIS